ncbi:cytochrome P450 [Irpex rosettiformis]|uniref:Cytochrome P450 n=1 Tax=Irpex rosettiformis TaxID=378272 RepID=A0ACB8UKA0_9APHY|nr:cytochrome P450 [Irpex rosettiformis]
MVTELTSSFSFVFLAVVGCGVSVSLVKGYVLNRNSNHARLPPGPKASWFGSVSLPKQYQWKIYADWKAVYGDIIYVHIFGNPLLVLNTAEAVNDLFEKRGAIYSSRPVRTMVSELIGFDWLFSTMPYGNRWRRHRALFLQYFTPSNVAIRPVISQEVDTLLLNLSESPQLLFHHVKRTTAAIAMMISYGHQIAPEGDYYVSLADQALSYLARAGLFGTYLVDYISPLKYVPAWLPGASFKRQALEWRQSVRAMLNRPFKMVQQHMAEGTAVPCFATAELERLAANEVDPCEEELVKNVAAIAYAGGADTTVNAILSFFLAIMVYPEVLVNAQAEIDRVIGNGRLPTLDDRHDLPYIEAVVWECLRWNPVTPLGLARKMTENDEYRGYLIPKGTTVLPNVWGILHDEQTYPDPLKFDPDRFLDKERNRKLGINEQPTAAFGFGRRSCPGQWIAVDTIWLTVATASALYDITKPCDDQGRTVEPDTEYTSQMLSGPKPFQCSITPRSDMALRLIRQIQESR